LLRRALPIAAIVVGTIGVARSTADAGTFDEDLAGARESARPALVELAQWCHGNRLFKARNDVAESILTIDPEHRPSRGWLKFKRAKGEWKPPKKPPTATDRNAEALSELPAKRAELLGSVADAYLAVLDAHTDSISPEQRETALIEAIAIVPADENLRLVHGDVRDGDGWVLRETKTARERRKAITAAAHDAKAAAKDPEKIAVPDDLQSVRPEWTCAFRTADVEVFGASESFESKRVAVCSQAVPALLRVALGLEVRHDAGFRVFVLPGATARDAFLASHPAFDAEARASAALYESSWVPDTSALAVYDDLLPNRVDSAVNQLIGTFLHQQWRLDSRKTPWAGEGLTVRLTWELTGTRLTFSRRESEYADAADPWAEYGTGEDPDWYGAALHELEQGTVSTLLDVVYRPINDFTVRDAILAQAMAAYLLEGRPKQARELFRRIGRGEASLDALRTATGLDLAALRLRLIRWLRERGP